MKKLLLFLCGISLVTNVALGWRAWRNAQFEPPTTASSRARTPGVSALTARLPLELLETGGPEELRDRLRNTGIDERTIRAVIEGTLRNRYREKLTAERLEQLRRNWWKTRIIPGSDDAKMLRASVAEPLQKALGADPLDQVDAESRYTFLPAEKRRKLAQIDQDYREMRAQLQVPPGTSDTQTRAEQEQLRLLANERRKDVLAELTSEERTEMELRFSDVAHGVIARMNNIAATGEEYRPIKPAMDEFQAKAKQLAAGDEVGRGELERETVRQLVATFGYDRAVDIVWAGYNEYAGVARAARAMQLPENTVGSVMTLNAETGLQAAAIHRDEALTAEQKQAALVALQQSARSRLDALLPPAAQQLLEPATFTWLTELAEGKYRVMSPGLTGYNGYMPLSLNQPPPKAKSTDIPLMPVRPPPSR
jgi:hypothetical protein